jgi:hypothetical protein
MTFGRCTPARGRGALPLSPSVIPAQCKPVRGHESLDCVATLACHLKQCRRYRPFMSCFLHACHYASLYLYVGS